MASRRREKPGDAPQARPTRKRAAPRSDTSLNVELRPSTRARLQALSEVTRKPIAGVIDDTSDLYVDSLSRSERAEVKRKLQHKT